MPRKAAEADIFSLPVLPAADVFPMMAPDELEELAEDIKAHGLREPVVTALIKTDDGEQLMVVDGRNRRAACRKAGIVPAVRQLDGEDPTAFVMSANIHRRHLTKGQRAMATAMIYPEPKQGKRTDLLGGSDATSLATKEVSAYGLSAARTVLRHAPEMVPAVMAGSTKLDDAYQTAKDRKERQELEKAKAGEEATLTQKRLAELRERYEALADKVVEGELTLKEAEAEAKRRDVIREQHFDDLVKDLHETAHNLENLARAREDLLAFLADPARRMIVRDRAYTFGSTITGANAEAGFDALAKALSILRETEELDPKGERE